MPTQTLEDLLQPVSADKPAGEDQSGGHEWLAIKEARRSDDKFNRGTWDRPLKEANWHSVEQLCLDLLQKTKDLRLAVFLTEAKLNLDGGFPALTESLRLIRRMLVDFWDTGLLPALEDGDPQYRAQALEWLGEPEKLPSLIRGIALTKRSDSGADYSLSNYEDARDVGWEKDLRTPSGDLDEAKAQRRAAKLADGRVSREMFEAALTSTPRAAIEALAGEFESAWEELLGLDKAIDDKFQGQGPGLQASREAFEDYRSLIQETQKKKREQEPDPVQSSEAAGSKEGQSGNTAQEGALWADDFTGSAGSNGSWQAAEAMVRAGQVKEGLAEMTRLAASEHGRVRFTRKLKLAETCFSINRDRLAVAILEELAKEIDEHHLESWESAELLGRVWGRLYRSYKSSEAGSARAAELFDRLCRLDPWQALRWDG